MQLKASSHTEPVKVTDETADKAPEATDLTRVQVSPSSLHYSCVNWPELPIMSYMQVGSSSHTGLDEVPDKAIAKKSKSHEHTGIKVSIHRTACPEHLQHTCMQVGTTSHTRSVKETDEITAENPRVQEHTLVQVSSTLMSNMCH